jgi:hypothetical protein
MIVGDIKRAEEHFKNALDRTKGPTKKKYSFVALVGMVNIMQSTKLKSSK